MGRYCAVLLLAAAASAANLVSQPGFENEGGWEAVGTGYARDLTVAHDGRASARCVCARVGEVSGVMQTVVLKQAVARPVLLSAWTRSAVETGRMGPGYSLWADVEYTTDSRPGRVDLPGQLVRCRLTTEWRRYEVLITPDMPIAQVKIYGLFRKDYAGTVWWDDFELTELERQVLSVDGEPPPVPLEPAGTRGAWQRSAGGLSLSLASDGAWAGLTARGTDLLAGRPAGLYLGDFHEGVWRPLAGRVAEEPDGALAVAWERPEMGLTGTVRYRTRGEGLELTGTVRDTRGTDRAVDVLLWLPVSATGLRWEGELDEPQPVAGGLRRFSREVPLTAVGRAGGFALGLAIPPRSPQRFELGVSTAPACAAAGLAPVCARALLGLAPETRPPGSGGFAFYLAAPDPAWGLRDLVRRWYGAYPDAFERRAVKEGLWQFAIDTDKLPDPRDYAYHEGSPNSLAADAANGILTMPYLIPTQLALYRMETLPRTVEEVERLLDRADRRATDRGGVELPERIRTSVVHDADGGYTFVARDDVGADIKPPKPINNVVFPVNCDPDLMADQGLPNAGGYYLDAARALVEQYPGIGGIYLDSVSGWVSRYDNYRRDHLPYSALPATRDERGRVCLDGRWHVIEYLRALGELLHPRGLLIFPNLGTRTRSTFFYPDTDVVGLEGHGVDLAMHRYYRMMSCQKPILRLDYLGLMGQKTELATAEGMAWYVKSCAQWGIHPSIGRRADEAYTRNRALMERWLPLIRELSAAGWQPVTSARAEGLLVERFGDGDPWLLTVLNPGKEAVRSTLKIDVAGSSPRGPVAVVDRVNQRDLPGRRDGDTLSCELSLPGRDALVLELRGTREEP